MAIEYKDVNGQPARIKAKDMEYSQWGMDENGDRTFKDVDGRIFLFSRLGWISEVPGSVFVTPLPAGTEVVVRSER